MDNNEDKIDDSSEELAKIIEAAEQPYTPDSEVEELQSAPQNEVEEGESTTTSKPQTPITEEDTPTKKRQKNQSTKIKSSKRGFLHGLIAVGRGIKIFLKFINPIKLIRGRIISIDLFFARWKVITSILVIMLFYISNRYTCQQSIAEIGVLKKQKREIQYKSLNMFTKLKLIKREESLQEIIKERGIELEYPTTPPYVIDNEQ